MAQKSAYATQMDNKNIKLINAMLVELPSFVKDFINARSINTAVRTLLNYTYGIRRFLTWMQTAIPHLSDQPVKSISLDDLSHLTAKDFEEFMLYLQADPLHTNSRDGVAQKMAAVGSLFTYLYKNDFIENNPMNKLERPKVIKDKRIIYLTDEECIRLLDVIEYGSDNVPAHQMAYLQRTRCRDLAIITLMLNTGIRRSECVGLNLTDINLTEGKMQVYRKGGKFQYIPLNSEVIEILRVYIEERKRTRVTTRTDEKALFLSMQNRRINGSTIENMLKKYALMAGITKPITPHKLRKTYGTALYRKTRDIYLTANALGHDNVSTTSRHYVNDSEESLKEVAEDIRIRQHRQDQESA